MDGERLARWCAGFGERHGGEPTARRDAGRLVLTAPDGSVAVIEAPFGPPADVGSPHELIEWVTRPRRCVVLIVRRGGFAGVVVDGARVIASKIGHRRVQGRTAAGGWSQQRFARRRDNQAQALVEAAAEVAVRLFVGARAQWLVTGGDRSLVDRVLTDRRLPAVAALPRGPHLALGDPRSQDVRDLPRLLAEVRIDLTP